MSDTLFDTLIISVSKFPLGLLSATPNALSKLSHEDISVAFNRHCNGDWGTLDAHDMCVNERGIKHGGRLFSVYASEASVRFYIITEADRSATTILLPEDY